MVMIDIVARQQTAIAALCAAYDVRKLWLFGSAAKGTWSSDASDLDFIVDLGTYEPGVSDRFLGLLVALESLFDMKVDLLTHRQMKSDWFREEVEASRVLIYDSTRQTVVA